MNRHDRRKFRAVTAATSRPLSKHKRRESKRLLLIVGGFAAALFGACIWLIADLLSIDLTVFVSPGPPSATAEQWVEGLRGAGFHVHVRKERDFPGRRTRLHIPPEFAAEICAVTANPSRYVLSGYVPVDAVVRMLREQPAYQGLLLPDAPQAGRSAPPADSHDRDIWGFWSDGQKELFMHREAPQPQGKPGGQRGKAKALANANSEAPVASWEHQGRQSGRINTAITVLNRTSDDRCLNFGSNCNADS